MSIILILFRANKMGKLPDKWGEDKIVLLRELFCSITDLEMCPLQIDFIDSLPRFSST